MTLGRFLFLLLILLSALHAGAANEPGEPAADAQPSPTPYARALELYRAGQLARAVEILEQTVNAGDATTAHLTLLGWSRFRRSEIDAAAEAFDRAVALKPDNGEAITGRGYVELRRGQSQRAEASFFAALALEPDSGDAAKGLGLARQQRGDHKGAREAFQRAVELSPADAEARALLETNLLRIVEERRPRAAAGSAEPLRVGARANAGRLEVYRDGAWRPIFVKGLNLGTTLPGKFPAEFPDDAELYREWFDQIGELGANVVRLYTLHPPSLYRALKQHNDSRPEHKLWLVQGVWTELPAGHDYDAPGFVGAFNAEVRRVIDAVHGNLELPERPGHAHGVYAADLAADVLAYVLGREWEPFSVDAYNAAHPDPTSFDGRYVRLESGLPIEAWLASTLETALAHESEYYRWQHPVSFTSWPTLDPLVHPTEATVDEEMRFRGQAGDLPPEEIKEYDNDKVNVDIARIVPTEHAPAGIFATYHAYPYYPEFMVLDPDYAKARDAEGTARYLGYLKALQAHHGDQPVIIAEFGVPTSRGIAHLQPEGQHHGGHTEDEQGKIDARLLRNMHEAGLAGGILFAWMDEWFKRNWLVMFYESPPARNPMWLNALDAEQNFGLLAARPGAEGPTVVLDGRGPDWAAIPPLYESTGKEGKAPGEPTRLRITSDEAYLYLALETEPAGAPFGDGRFSYWIGIDTHDAGLGDHRFPPPVERATPIGLEFLVQLSAERSSILVDRPYDLFSQRNRRPYRSVNNDNADFIEIRVYTNRDRYGRDGTYYPAQGYSRSPLRRGTTAPQSPDYNSLADWMTASDGSLIELRLPWGLLNVADPSSHQVVHESTRTEGIVETAPTTGFRFHVIAIENRKSNSKVLSTLPISSRPTLSDFPTYLWLPWEHPTYHLELKKSYFILQEAFATLP
jgi:tetratricopeptide (TPR) repeat protein